MGNAQRIYNLMDDVVVCIHDFPLESGYECPICFHQKLVVEEETYEQEKHRIWGTRISVVPDLY